LAVADGAIQDIGAMWKLSPSVFVRAQAPATNPAAAPGAFFRCPACRSAWTTESCDAVTCDQCGRAWPVRDGIYEFKS